MARLKLEFEGFTEVASRLKRLEGDVKNVTERALKESRNLVTPNLHKDMTKHRRTGKTEASIASNEPVKWIGSQASIHVGFNIKEGGLPSIFLMYGTPRIKKDTKLYNDIFGTSTQNKIKKLQEDIFYEEIRKLGG